MEHGCSKEKGQTIKEKPKFLITSPHPCSYLEEKLAQTVFLAPDSLPSHSDYSVLVQNGFRRSGEHIYRPNCESCNACISVRVRVGDFNFKRRRFSRILKKNADLRVTHQHEADLPDLYGLYEKYIEVRHRDGDMFPSTPQQYTSFLRHNLGNCEYLVFSLGDTPVAVAVTDYLSDGMASVYTFFDCDLKNRSLGSMAILYQIQHCQQLGLPFLYLGYWIKECRKMNYKKEFQPLEYYIGDRWLKDQN